MKDLMISLGLLALLTACVFGVGPAHAVDSMGIGTYTVTLPAGTVSHIWDTTQQIKIDSVTVSTQDGYTGAGEEFCINVYQP